MCIVAKTLNDEKVAHFAYRLFARMLSYLNACHEAIELAYYLVDLALEMRDFARAMDSYGLLGQLLEQAKDYRTAMVAYRKML